MTRIGFSCGSRALTTSRDWVTLIGEVVGDDGDTVEVASAVLWGPHLLQKWDIQGDDLPRVVEVAASIERTLREYTACWASGFYRCLVIRVRSDVQLLRSRVLSIAVTSPLATAMMADVSSYQAPTIELPADLIRAIENYLAADITKDPSGLGRLNAVAHIGERVAALWSVAHRQPSVSEAPCVVKPSVEEMP